MAITVGTDTYISVADADAYHTAHGDSDDWSSASTAEKEGALRLGTQALDLTHRGRWQGRRSTEAQALDWPRDGVYDADGYLLLNTATPSGIANASAELARRHITDETALMPDTDSAPIKSESVQVGSLKETIEYVAGKATSTRFDKVDRLVAPYLRRSGALERS